MSERRSRTLAGFRDLVGQAKFGTDEIRAEVLRDFQLFGYKLVQPPVVSRSEPFLDRSGEEIRQRMYIFLDPSGNRVCLRPELTIPTCRLFLDEYRRDPDSTRLCYDGLVFRYEPVGHGRYREFRQLGVEQFGGHDPLAADAECISLAYHSAVRLGLTPLTVDVNDIQLINSLFQDLNIPLPARTKLLSRLGSTNLQQEILAHSSDAAPQSHTSSEEVNSIIEKVGADSFAAAVREILRMSGSQSLGTRTLDDIARRFITKTQAQSRSLTTRDANRIEEFLGLGGRSDEALNRLREFAARWSFESLQLSVSKMSRRAELATKAGVPAEAIVFKPNLRRSLQYYTGFIFEIHWPELGAASEICGGGRYDGLLSSLGAGEDIGAVGFAFGADRLHLAVQRNAAPPPPRAVVAPAGNVDVGECLYAAQLFRKSGWAVEVESSGRRPRSTISMAIRRGIPFIVFVGDDELKRGGVKLKSLASRSEEFIGYDFLPARLAQLIPNEEASRCL